jgi:hypothetical protein
MASTNRKWFIVGIVALILLIAGILLTAWLSAESNVNFESSAVVLSVIGASAVGIERVIEMIWTFIGLVGGTRWPLGSVVTEAQKLVTQLDQKLTPAYQKASQTIDKVAQANQWTQAKIDAAKGELANLQTNLDNVKTLALYDPNIQQMVTAASQGILAIQKTYPDLANLTNVANLAISDVTDFVSSFKENPGRKLISIYLGAFIGLALSGFMGLDMFQATLETPSGSSSFNLGVALTGVIIGLGANPTHEVISILKEIKLSRKAKNQS